MKDAQEKNWIARTLIFNINQSNNAFDTAKEKRAKSYKAFADFIKQEMKRYDLHGGIVCQRMGWKRHTLGNLLNQGDRLPEEEMLRLVDALHPLTAKERKAK